MGVDEHKNEDDEIARLQAEAGMLERKIGRLQASLEELEGITEHRTRELYQANRTLARFIPPQVSRLLGRESEEELIAHRAYVTIVFGDLEGFTDVAEVLDAEQMTGMINGYFDMVLERVADHGGLLDKFIGDGFMAFWGAPESAGKQEDAKQAARFALALREGFAGLAAQWRKGGLDHEICLRQGMHSGYCSVGNFGSNERLQYTAMGNPVNLAARLEGAAASGAVLTSHVTATMISGWIPVKESGKIRVKGIKHPVTTYTLEQEPLRTVAEPLEAEQITQLLGRLEETQRLDSKTMELLRQLAPPEATSGRQPGQARPG